MTLVRLSLKQARMGVLVVAALGAVFITVGAKAYDVAGGGASLAVLANNPSLRAILGVPWQLSTKGGFVAWRMTEFLALTTGIWVVFATTKQLRGAEDSTATELLLSSPMRRRQWLLSVFAALGLAGFALACGVGLAARVSGLAGSSTLLYAASLGLGLLTFAGIAAVASQVMAQRRSANGLALATVALFFVVRMTADAIDTLGWLRWFTPFGWIEEVRAFDADQWVALLPLLVAPLLLGALTAFMLDRRDLGAGLINVSGRPTSHEGLLSSPSAFAVRRRVRELRWWLPATFAGGILYGYLAGQVVDFIQTDAGYRQLVAKLGGAGMVTVEAYLASIALLLSVIAAAYVIVVVHADADDEIEGRLDLVYATRVTRDRWFVATGLSAFVGALTITGALGMGLVVGVAAGGGGVTVAQTLAAVFALTPVVVAVLAVCALGLGLLPRHVGVAAASVLAAWLLVAFFGPLLQFPDWIVQLTPYNHIGAVPADSLDVAGVVVVSALGGAGVVAGWWFYRRRDLAT